MIQQEVEDIIQKVFGSASKKINSKKLTIVSNNEKLNNLEGLPSRPFDRQLLSNKKVNCWKAKPCVSEAC